MIGIPAATYFVPHLRQLRACGYAKLAPEHDHYTPYHNILRHGFFIVFPIYITQIFIFTVENLDDLSKSAPSLLLFFVFLPAFAKLAVMRFREERILKIVNYFYDPLFNQDFEEHRVILERSAIIAKRFLNIFQFGAMSTTFVWTIYPLMEFHTWGHSSVGCSFGFDYNRMPYFYFALLYVRGLLVIIATGNVGMDCLISAILGQCKTQLTLLRYNFENFYEICQKYSEERNEDFSVSLKSELVRCIRQYEKIFYIVKEHEDIFGSTIFFQLNISGWIICMVAYRLVSLNTINLEFLCMVMFSLLMITECCVYCYYGNEVKYESEFLVQSIYAMNWLDTPLSFQKSLIIMMEKFKVILTPTAMKIIPLSLETFVKIKMVSSAGSCFDTPLRMLRAVGYLKLHKTANPMLRRLHDIYMVLMLCWASLYFLQECYYAYLVRNNMDLLARVMFLLLTHITSSSKQIVFFIWGKDIEALIDTFDDPVFNQPDAYAQSLLRNTAKNASKLATSFFSAAVLTCTLWIVFPVIDHYQGRHVEFFFWMGNVDSDRPIVFIIFVLYTYTLTSVVAVGNTCMDSCMATVLYQVQTQFTILRHNLENFPEKCLEVQKERRPRETYENILHRHFAALLEHYEKIHKTARDLEEVFHVCILIEFTIGGWVLCMAAYKIVDLDFFTVEFASMVLFILCILTELFLYCFFGNEAAFESQLITNSIYAMNWLDTPVTFRKTIILVMERVKRPLNPTAGRIIPLTLLTFVTILKSSYTFYAVLNQMKS